MKTFGKVMMWIGGALVAFLAFGFYISNTPDGQARAHERQVIEKCWEEQERKSLTPEASRFVAGACEMLEDKFRSKWNRDP